MELPDAPASGDSAAVKAVVTRYVADLDHHVGALVERLKNEIAEYRGVPSEDVFGSTRAIIESALHALVAGEVDAGAIAALDQLARRRVQQGFPLEALTRSIQLAARYVLRDIHVHARSAGVDDHFLLDLQDRGWQFANDAAATISAINRELATDLARRDSGRRSDFLRSALHGGIDTTRMQAEAALYGLDPVLAYHPLRARPRDRPHEDALAFAIRRTGSTMTHRPVLGVLEGELVGLTPRRPVVDDGPVALGDARRLVDVREAFLTTGPVLDAAITFRRTGVITPTDLGPLPLALRADAHADALERRYLAPLDAEGPTGRDIEDTVRALLSHDQNFDAASRALHVHPNTARYRLGRFRDLTGLDLRRTDDFVTTWWLLSRRAARHLHPPADAPPDRRS